MLQIHKMPLWITTISCNTIQDSTLVYSTVTFTESASTISPLDVDGESTNLLHINSQNHRSPPQYMHYCIELEIQYPLLTDQVMHYGPSASILRKSARPRI